MTGVRVSSPAAIGPAQGDLDHLWVLSGDAARLGALARDRLADELRLESAPGSLLLVTCHRVELYGSGTCPAAVVRNADDGARLLRGRAAVHHAMRIATGLESSVVGEDQILAQLRRAADGLDTAAADPVLVRLVQAALAIGRRARRGPVGRDRGLTARALHWLGERLDGWNDARILVIGAGDMGTSMALGATRRGAEVLVATRTPRRLAIGLDAIPLESAAVLAGSMDGIVVALGGRWPDLLGDARTLPPLVDLSSPAVVSPEIAARAIAAIGIDELFDGPDGSGAAPSARTPGAMAFVARAEAEVRAAEDSFVAWVAARQAAPAARRLGQLAAARIERRTERALRRLPQLDEHGREIVRQLATQLAADLLHEPLSRLGTDASGSARVAARELYDL